jgi:hypothetical protein
MSTIVLRGANPLIIDLGRDRIGRIEWISHWLPGDEFLKDPDPGLLHNVSAYVTYDGPIDERLAERVYVIVKARVPHLLLDVEIAPIPWFPHSSQFPILGPFSHATSIPALDEYSRMTKFACRTDLSAGVRCR